MTISGSLLLPELSRRFGLKRLLLAAIAADVASMRHDNVTPKPEP